MLASLGPTSELAHLVNKVITLIDTTLKMKIFLWFPRELISALERGMFPMSKPKLTSHNKMEKS